jgi:hypothetical protein
MAVKTYKQKLAWLRTNKVILKKELPRESTVDRLYSFYQRNPLSTPRNLAYGLPKRIEKTIEAQKEFKTPKGKITAKQYIKTIDYRTARQIRQTASPSAVRIKFSHRFKSQKREDSFRYNFRNRKGIIINSMNVKNALLSLERIDIPDLMEIIELFFLKRGDYFYKNRLIGALILYDTENMPDDPIPRPVAFVTKDEFPKYLWDMIYQLLTIDILRNYKNAIIKLKHLNIYIRTREKPTNVELLL